VNLEVLELPYMNKGCGDQNTSTEMFTEKENLRVDLHPLDLLCNDWKSTTSNGCEEDDN
jgi:hypothetical protein